MRHGGSMHILALRRFTPAGLLIRWRGKALWPRRTVGRGTVATWAVEGSDPRATGAWFGRGAVRVFTRPPPPPLGSLPSNYPCRKALSTPLRGGGAATARRPMTCGIGSVHIRTALSCTWTPISHVHSRPAPGLAGSGSGNGRPSRSSASPRTTSKSWFGTRRSESSSAPEQRPGPGSSTGGTGARGIARLARMPFPREVSGAQIVQSIIEGGIE